MTPLAITPNRQETPKEWENDNSKLSIELSPPNTNSLSNLLINLSDSEKSERSDLGYQDKQIDENMLFIW